MIRLPLACAILLLGPVAASAATWAVDPARSSLGFSGKQTGEAFSGRFKTFAARIGFDPAKPEAAHVSVTVDTGSAVTGDGQRDEAMPGEDWFSAKAFPQASFEATGFKPLGGDRYEADGLLTIRGVSKPVVLPFTLAVTGDTAHATGHADLLRSAFGVGQGSWASDEYVAFEVGVDIDLTATRTP